MTSLHTDYNQTWLRAYIAQLQPREWNRPIPISRDGVDEVPAVISDWSRYSLRWDLVRFFDWPPDVFFLTSLLLHHSGAYRAGVTPPAGVHWPEKGWQEKCQEKAREWRDWLCRSNRLGRRAPMKDHPLRRYIACLRLCYKLPIYDLYNVETVMYDRRKLKRRALIWVLCRCLLELNAIADEAMRGVGTLFAPRTSLKLYEKHAPPAGIERLHLQANLLLALRGTLSRIGKHRGIVLPKSRTPQAGVTLRSLSLHLSFHQTEVDVTWRAIPWTNFDEDALSLLIVPWPYQINPSAFRPDSSSVNSERVGGARYFSYTPPSGADGLDVRAVVQQVLKAQRESRRIHVIVLPEAALTWRGLRELKRELEEHLAPGRMPLIVSGVTGTERTEPADGEPPAEHTFNRVVLSLFYAHKWFDMVQDKHHRWKLDPDQIAAYSLSGSLSGTRSWWESIQIPRRRLSFLTSNAWLTLTPLICEDLARLEPVSELIRGVGPTLLIALLLDGPQLTTRWSARYAGVLADDPGTSVLTVTSLGMVQRSVPARATREEAGEIRTRDRNVVALWNDQVWKWHPIVLNKDDQSALLTVATRWIQEDTFDMREEAENSAVFTFQSLHVPECDVEDRTQPPADPGVERADMQAALVDMGELTLYTFFVDALVDVDPGEEKPLRQWVEAVIGRIALADGSASGGRGMQVPTDRELLDLIRWSLWHRKRNPVTMPTPQLILGLYVVTRIVERATRTASAPVSNLRPKRGSRSTASAERDEGNPEPYARWASLVKCAREAIETCSDRMRRDIECEPSARRYARHLREIVRRFDRLGDQAHANVEASERYVPSGARVRLNVVEAGRIIHSAPLSLLWAVHNRLSIRRRTRALLHNEAGLLEEIERLLDSDFHQPYVEWKRSLSAENPAVRG